jgi:hypothetical protein
MPSTKYIAIDADNANDPYIKDACNMSDPRLHKYFIEYEKQDNKCFERWSSMCRAKECFLPDLIYWTFDNWYFDYKMSAHREEFIQLYGREQLPISKKRRMNSEVY